LDRETQDFHLRVAQGYKEVLEKYKHRMTVIDANRPVADIVDDALSVILKRVKDNV
jgi:dTMP kinase